MDSKRGLVVFVLIFAFVIFSISLVSSTSCTVTTSCNSPNHIVMKLSSLNNAHGELYSGTNYNNYYLCCSGMSYVPTHNCDGSNTVLKLSYNTNAHAEVPYGSVYSNLYRACLGELSCTYVTASSCPVNIPPYIPMLSLSSTTNAHLGNFSTYPVKICCVDTGAVICGNGDVESGEACDDGNLNSGDGCSYPACSVEPGYACIGDPSCCYDTTPRYAWFLDGAAFSGGAIRQGQLLKMTIYDDLCLASGSGPTFTIYEGSTSRATNSSVVSSKVPGGEINSTYPISSSFLTALGSGTSQIFFRITSPSTYTSNTITVDPIYCGDGTCDSGENCLNCASDCGCNPATQECSAGVCVGLCDLTSATWNYSTPVGSSVLTGTPVRLNIAGTNCNGKTINFAVREKDGALNPDDAVSISPSSLTFPASGTTTYLLWNSVYTSDTDGGQSDPPEYYFTASVSGYSETITSSNTADSDNLLLRVRQAVTCPNGVCGAGENCGNCAADCACTGATRCESNACVTYCGNGVCDGTETCATCADCACGSGRECSSGSCVLLCDLNGATWNMTTSTEGQPVRLQLTSVAGTNCAGKTINFEIFEKDGALNPDDSVTPGASSLTFPASGTSTYVTWNSVFQSDTDGGQSNPPEYYFRASVSGYSETITSSNTADSDPLLLKVNQLVTCPNGVCGAGENCGNCAADCGCGASQECSAGTCVPLCDLNTVTWNYSTPVGSSIVSGTPVRLQVNSVAGTNCAGKTISFSVFEKDGALNPDDSVTPGPSTITFPASGTSTYVTWTSVFQSDTDGGQSDPPEYYFRASVSGYSETATSSNTGDSDALLLRVSQFVPCGNGICDGTETCATCALDCACAANERCEAGPPAYCSIYCGNGLCDGTETTATCPGDCPPATCNNNGICGDLAAETCATCPGDCACGALEQCNAGVCQTYCGNGVCDGTETCSTCVPDCGCTGPLRCEIGSCVPYCGNGICGDSAGEDCDGCVADCGCTAPQVCEPTGLCTIQCALSAASWNLNQVVAGNPVNLNIIGSNCDGKTINFAIWEKDGALNPDDDITSAGGTNPASITFPVGEATTSVTWTAFYMSDNDGGQIYPPEYYFRASVQGESASVTSSNLADTDPLLLKVLDPAVCVGISLCSHYDNEYMCNNDGSFCNIADNEDAACGTTTYNPLTRCSTTIDCGCNWNSISGTCGPQQDITTNCDNCGNDILEGNEICDGALLQLRDNSCTRFDAYTSGEVSCYASGEPEECTYDFSACVTSPVCGNGVREEGEECDDGNTINTDECSYPGCVDLVPGSVCGNNIIEEGEVCDGTLLQLSNPPVCSNFDLYADDGELVSCYPAGHDNECRYNFNDCNPNPVCGNGVREEGEECDDGNTLNDDCSYPDCKLSIAETPGVGICDLDPQGDEVCDGREFITRTFVGTWLFPIENEFTAIPTWGDASQFVEDTDALGNLIYRYDPEKLSVACEAPREPESIRCPALVQLPFFGIYQVIAVLVLVALIYLVYDYLKKRKKVVSKNVKRLSKSKRKSK